MADTGTRPCARQRLASLLIAGAALCASTAAVAVADSRRSSGDDEVVAEVNGTPVLRRSVRELVHAVLVTQDERPDAAALDRLAREALNSLINHELLYQESRAEGIVVSDAAIDEELARSKAIFPDAASFEEAIRARGVTEGNLRQETRKTLAVNRLLEARVFRNVVVPEAEVKQFYERNREEFRHPEEIRAQHILVRVPAEADDKTRDAAAQRAAALLAQLKAGADFADLARQHSNDPGTAAHGGDLGYFGSGQMVQAFEVHAFALQSGELSDVVSTPYGFHIIKVTDRRPAGIRPLSEVEDRIRAVLAKSERQRLRDQLVDELRRKADVRVYEL
jgi:peptidyl-prolyl cis-trans isomerase C